MAIVALPFFIMLLGTMEVAYDVYVQAALNAAVTATARSVYTGQAQMVDGSAGGTAFASAYVCPNLSGTLECGNILINLHKLTATDFYTNVPPAYATGLGTAATLNTASWSVCTGGPGASMFMQAVYAGPTFVGGLLHEFIVTYGGAYIHPTYATNAWVNQSFTATVSC